MSVNGGESGDDGANGGERRYIVLIEGVGVERVIVKEMLG